MFTLGATTKLIFEVEAAVGLPTIDRGVTCPLSVSECRMWGPSQQTPPPLPYSTNVPRLSGLRSGAQFTAQEEGRIPKIKPASFFFLPGLRTDWHIRIAADPIEMIRDFFRTLDFPESLNVVGWAFLKQPYVKFCSAHGAAGRRQFVS